MVGAGASASHQNYFEGLQQIFSAAPGMWHSGGALSSKKCRYRPMDKRLLLPNR
jgi:hypothetical protein